jgi:hypothetical protein
MIGKRGDLGTGFRGIMNYLLRGSKADPHGPDRVAFAHTRNLAIDNPDEAPQLMRWTAEANTRVQKPVYHFCISWHRDENPNDEAMVEAADRTCFDLGLGEHQAVYVAHNDTDHRHIHIMANRVHPETRRAWSNSHDYKRIEQSVGEQAKAKGFRFVPGRHNTPQDREKRPRRARAGEYRMAKRTGTKPRRQFAINRLKDLAHHLGPEFDAAYSWADLSNRLAGHRMRLEKKGQGLIITDGVHEMKLSHVGRQVRLKTLQEKFNQSWSAFDKELREKANTQTKPDKPTSPKPTQHTSNRPSRIPGHVPTVAELAEEHARELMAEQKAAKENAASPFATLTDAFSNLKKPKPDHPLITARDLAYAFHNLGWISKEQLQQSLEHIAQDEQSQRSNDRPRSALDLPLIQTDKDSERER